jgi:antitoxin MazE
MRKGPQGQKRPADVIGNAGKVAQTGLDHAADIRGENDRIVIEPVRPPMFDLVELVSAVTPKNRRDETNFGRPLGKEAL